MDRPNSGLERERERETDRQRDRERDRERERERGREGERKRGSRLPLTKLVRIMTLELKRGGNDQLTIT